MDINQFVELAERVHNAERMNFGSSSTRESRNRDWARIVGIAHHGHPSYNPTPDPQWHLKNGGGGRPQSDDVVVSLPSRKFWDCIPSAGADGYRFQASGHGDEALPSVQEVYAPPVPDGGGAVQPPVPVNDVWTAAHEQVRTKLSGKPAKVVAEQLAFNFPDEQWGEKRTNSGDWSKDTIARLVNGKIWAVKLNPFTIYGVLTTNAVHRQVQGVDHLQEVVVVDPPVVTPPPASQINDVLTALKVVIEENQKQTQLFQEFVTLVKTGDSAALTQALTRLSEQLDRGFNVKAKGGWPIGNIDASVTLKEQG